MKLRVPGSKSISNRALLISALAKGKSTLINVLDSEDTRAMIRALSGLGVKIQKKGNRISIYGGKLVKSKNKIFCNNSGTTLRFLSAVLASKDFESVLDGNKRMRERPVGDLVNALSKLGAKIQYVSKKNFPPLRICSPFTKNSCSVKGGISSQFLSGLLIAAPLTNRDITIKVTGELVSKPYVDLTLDVMREFGVEVERNGYKTFFIKAPKKYKPRNFKIEGDASSASYFWGIASLAGEKIDIINVPEGSLQADTKFKAMSHAPFVIDCSDFPDSAMTLAVFCAFLKGKFILTGLSNLRLKESDRLFALASELTKIGAKVKELKDGLIIHGAKKIKPAAIETYDDHRIAMCFGMAGVFIPELKIKNPSCVKKTYPGFWRDLAKVKKLMWQRNIVLSGMRGSGKSALGFCIAKVMKRDFVDIDRLIEKNYGRKIKDIVQQKGWKYFRKLENETVRKIHNKNNLVIATGGGTLMDPNNAKLLRKNGKIIYLDCPISVLKTRINSGNKRPSLTGKDFISELREVYEKRKNQYLNTADFVFDARKNSNSPLRDQKEKTEELIEIIHRFGIN